MLYPRLSRFIQSVSALGCALVAVGVLNAQPQSQLFQEWQANPANAILPDFSFVGFAHGEQSPPRVTAAQLPVYHVRDFGAFPDDTIDDRVAIQRAIDTAGANGGGIIQFDAGRYLFNSDGSAAPLWVRYSNIVMRGAGSGEDGTLLYGAAKYDWFFAQWTQPSMVHIAAPILKGVGLSYGDWNGAPGQDWYTGGWRNNAFYPDANMRLAYGMETIQRGSQRIKVDQPENFYPGQTILFGVRDKMVVVDLLSPWQHEAFYNDDQDSWGEREFVIHQVVTVDSVEGQFIRIKERAEWTYKLEHSIEIFPYRYIENVGVEDLRMEIVITPRDDRWDANGKGLQFAHVRNGWANNIVFVNMQSGLNLSATMNVTVSNVRLEGEPFHDSFKFLGAKYSLMENAVINNFRILEDGSIKVTDHGFAAQHNAQVNVFLDPVMPENCSIDLHSGEPFANLYDRVLGGRHAESGGAATTLHALPFHTFWNWSVKATDKVPYEFPVWTGNQTPPYSSWSIHTVKPIISGLHAHPDFPNTVSTQYTASHNFSTGYFHDPRVVAERIGVRVAPDSLYLGQLATRLSQERGRSEREGGIFVAIHGPTRIKAGQQVTYDLSDSLSELPLKYYYSMDRKNYTAVNGSSITLNLAEVGLHELTVRAVSQSGSVNFRHHRIEVFDNGVQVVAPRSRFTAMPRSFHSVEAGNVWRSKLIYDDGLKVETSSLWIAGNNFGIANESRNGTLNYGGVVFIELPAEGINLTGTSSKIGIGGLFGTFPQAPRMVARDIDGNWAMLDHPLVAGTNTFELAGKAWIDLPSQYQIASNAAGFDVTKVTAVGLAHHRQRLNFTLRSFLLRIDEFEITRGTNTLPTVALTNPSAGSVEVGGSITLTATASDAESAVTRVEFLINGKVFGTDTSAPYSTDWKPVKAGTYTVAARAYDTAGAFTLSAEVELTVVADSAPSVPGLTGASVATATVGTPFSFTFGVTGKASSMQATGVPFGLNFNSVTGEISGVPLKSGTYTIIAWASNVSGSSPAKTLNLTVNASSTASLALSVEGNGVFVSGQTVNLSALGQNIGSSVDFLVNGSLVASSASAPHTATWSISTPGTYQLQARSGSVYSPVRQIAVVSTELDSVEIAITNPESGASFSGGNPVITISGTLQDIGGDVSSVSVYSNTVLLGEATVTGSAFSFDWTAWNGYDHRVKAVANLHSGKGVQSAVVFVDVTQSQRPFVEILSPSPTVPLDYREALRFNGRAFDPDGSLVKVELWMGGNNRGDDTFDTFLGNAALNADGTWTYLASSNLRNGTLQIYAIAIDNTGDKTFTPILRVFRSARFADHPVYGDAGTYSMDLGESSRWDLMHDGDNVVLLNKERFSYNYDWQNFLPNSRVDHFRISGRFRLPHFPEPSNPDYVQAAIIGFGSNKAVYLTTTPGTSTGGTRVYWTLRQYVTSIVNSPVPGISSNDWVDFEVVRVDNTILVKLNGETIMSGTDNYVRGDGSVYLGNPRINGSRVLWDDIEFEELDASGQPVNRPVPTVTLTSPISQSLLPIGQSVIISGTFENIDTVDSIQIRSGTSLLGEAVRSGNSYSLNWTPQHSGNYALYASITDTDGVSTVSNVLRVRTGDGLSGFNLAPTINLLQPETDITRVEYTTIPFSGNFVDSDGQVDGILLIVNGNVGGAASRSGTSWSWSMPQLETATYTVFARATDDMGATSDSSSITVTLTPNQSPVVAWNQPTQNEQIVANSQTELSVYATDPDAPLGNITSVTFFANDIQIGQGINAIGELWSMNWTPRILGDYQLRALIKDSNRGEVWTAIRDVTVTVDPDPSIATVFYAGGAGSQELLDVNELSDGSIIAVGSTTNLNWLPVGVAPMQLTAPGLSSRGTGRMGFVLHMSQDMDTIYGMYHLPLGYAENLRWIRKTNKPGEATGTLYLSGALSNDEYFIGRLNNNFVNGIPTGFDWTINAATTGNSIGEQAWDVGGDGRVVYLDRGLNSGGTTIQLIRIINSAAQPMVLPQLRATHLAGTTDLTAGDFDPANPDNFGPRRGELFPTANASVISVPRDFRSQVVYGRDEFNQIAFIDRYTPVTVWEEDANNSGVGDWREMIPDENGSMKRGHWPMDIFLPAINFQWKDGSWTTYGYTGYKQGPSIGIPAITVDKETNDFYIGASAQSVFYDISIYGGPEGHQPDFEAFVIAYAADGVQKWWSRLYSEWTDTNGNGVIDYGPENEYFWVNAETHRSPPDQYVDGIAVDYTTEPKTVIVNGRAHGSAPMNLWPGNQIAANPGSNGFQNMFTGSDGNIHISWLGRLNADQGTLYNSTWVSGYHRNVPQTQSLYAEPIHDGWPSHNAGWPNLTSTWIEKASVRVGTDGRVYTVGVGPRMVTTFNAYQKLPRHTNNIFEGNSPWSAYVRVFEPNLATLAYSSSLTGIWSYDEEGTAVGADNTQLKGVFPTDNGLFLVGRTITDNGVARGNAIPVNNAPTWGSSTPNGLTGIFGRLSFATNQNIPPSVGITSPAGSVTIVPGSPLNISATASDFDGSIDRVEFFLDGVLAFTDYASPYGFTWTAPMTQRNYTLIARAYDNEGGSTNSGSRTITVYTENLPPAVSMAAPMDDTLIPRGSNIVLSANASDPDGSVTKLEFFANGVYLGDGNRPNTSQPFTLFWSPAAGIYDITARATDNAGAQSTSLSVKLTVGGVPTGFAIAVNFKDGPATDLDETGSDGYYWNSVGSTAFAKGNLRTLDGVSVTDITVDTGDNPFSFVSNSRGSNIETSHNGYIFPSAVTYSYAGDNWASSDRNGHAVVRLVSETSYTYSLTILSSRALNADQGWVTDFNVGGTYERTTNMTGQYNGGVTLTLDSAAAPDAWSAGTMGPFNTETVGEQQVFVLNVGANYRAAHINAMIVEAVPAYNNTAPVAHAGADFSVTDPNDDGYAEVTLDGTQSYDPDAGDSIFSYVWFIDNVEVASGATPSLSLPVGTTVITLVVLDEFFYEHSDTVSVTVLPSPGVPPVPMVSTSSPGQDMDNDGFGTVGLDGSSSYDPDNGDTIVSWKWMKTGVLLAQGEVVSVNLPVGTHTLTLVVTDNWNKSASTDFQVTILASPGVPPVAVVPADFSIENSEDKGAMPVPLDGSASYDTDGDALVLYQWKIGNSVIATGAQVAPILPIGTHTITLVVTDSWNMQGSASVVVTVYRPELVAPVAHAGLNQMIRDDNDSKSVLVQLDGSHSYDPLGPIGIISYTWRMNGEVVATGVNPTLQLGVGVHEIELTVIDDDNLSDSDVVIISVQPALTGPKTIIGLAGNNSNTDDRSQGGIYWNGFNLNTTTLSLRDSNNVVSGITLEMTNPFEFVNTDRGANLRMEIEGVSVPASIMLNSIITNYDMQRDGVASFNLLGLSENERVRLTVVTSLTHNTPDEGLFLGQVNMGGVWGGAFNRNFIGGESAQVDSAKRPHFVDFGTTAGVMPRSIGGNLGVDVNFGSAGSYNRGGIRMNALIIEITDLSSVNNPPIALDDSASTMASQAITIDVLANDSDLDPLDVLEIQYVQQGRNGSVAIQGQTVTYTPNAGFVGTDEFTYVVTDGKETSLAVVTVVVEASAGPVDPEPGFAEWIADAAYGLHEADRDLLADPDKDGIVNMMEYAMRLNPSLPGNLDSIIYLHQSGNQHRFRFRFNNDAQDMTYAIEYSRTLAEGSWQTVAPQNIATLLSEHGYTAYEATLPGSSSEPVFVRMRVQPK